MKRKHLALLTVTALLMSMMIFSTAGFAKEEEIGAEEVLSLDDGRLSDEEMMAAIDAYLNSKTLSSSELEAALASKMDVAASSESTFLADALNRSEKFEKFETDLGVIFSTVNIDSRVDEILSQQADTVVVSVYETTVIQYYAAPDIETLDVMGYGTDHVLTLCRTGNEYRVTADSYDERMLTGACSADRVMTPIYSDVAVEDVLTGEEQGEEVSPEAVANVNYDVTAAINYANNWCGVSVKDFWDEDGENAGVTDDGYNPAYTPQGNEGSADCANFVSQCLKAGGLLTNSEWEPYTPAWINAKRLHRYLDKLCDVEVANNKNVFPGNPVYFWHGLENDDSASPSGHQMICTGYNSAGTPVVNAHNPNYFRIPISSPGIESGTSGLRTALLVSSNQHAHAGERHITPATHGMMCIFCHIGYNVEAHTVVTTASGKRCSVCGYTGPFSAIMRKTPENAQE